MTLGLVLSGGGARGAMHLGCIQALEEEGLTFQYISGTSAGALVGAFYCKGYAPRQILEIIEGVNFLSIFRPALNWRGLINIEKAYDEIKKYMGEDSFEALNIPLSVSATDIQKGKVKVFSKGELIKPVLASCSVPVIFDPIRIGRKIYVDGGITDNLPVKPIKKKCTKIIGLHCNPIGINYRGTSWRDLLERSLVIAITRSILPQKKKCDLFIEPQEVARYRVSDFKRMRNLYQIGYEHTGELIAKGALDKFKIRKEA